MTDAFEQFRLDKERAVMSDEALLRGKNPVLGFYLRINAAQSLQDLYVNSSGSRLFIMDVIFLRCQQGVINLDTALGKIRQVIKKMVTLGATDEMKAKIKDFKARHVRTLYMMKTLDLFVAEYTRQKTDIPWRIVVAMQVYNLMRKLRPGKKASVNKPVKPLVKPAKPLVRPVIAYPAIGVLLLAALGGLDLGKIQEDTSEAVEKVMFLVGRDLSQDDVENSTTSVGNGGSDIETDAKVKPKLYGFKVILDEVVDEETTIEEWKKDGWVVFHEWEFDDEGWRIERSEDDFGEHGFVLKNSSNDEHYYIKNLDLRPGKDTVIGAQIFPKGVKRLPSSGPKKGHKGLQKPKYYGFKVKKDVFLSKPETIAAWKSDGWIVEERSDPRTLSGGFVLTDSRNGERYWVNDSVPSSGKNLAVGRQIK